MLNKRIAVSLYHNMLRIRMAEETILNLYPEQEMRCPIHLCIGQEAIPAGVCANLRKEDYIMSNHRSHGHYLAKGGDMKAMFAEIYGKSTGYTKGKGGSMHLVDLSVNMLGATSIVAGVIPVACGVAFGTMMKKEKRITVVFFGEAAMEEGVFGETLNFASLKKLPIIFVCENNLFSVYSPLSVRQPKERDNLVLAQAYGIRSLKKDGNNVEEVYLATEKAVRQVKDHGGPYYLEFETYRWREHCGPNYDNALGYRDRAEFIKWRKRCPVELYEKRLLENKIVSKGFICNLKMRIQSEIEAAVKFAKDSPFPAPDELLSCVYSQEIS